jgi:hypothetical protein
MNKATHCGHHAEHIAALLFLQPAPLSSTITPSQVSAAAARLMSALRQHALVGVMGVTVCVRHLDLHVSGLRW